LRRLRADAGLPFDGRLARALPFAWKRLPFLLCPFLAAPCAQREECAWREVPVECAPAVRDAPLLLRATRPLEVVCAGLRLRACAGGRLK
jgi:hypothetical protein